MSFRDISTSNMLMAIDDSDKASINERVASGRTKRSLIETQDEDQTFLPPALSSYSIALLNEKTKQMNGAQHITGIYELDFQKVDKQSALKNKLSVHFGESHNADTMGIDKENEGGNNVEATHSRTTTSSTSFQNLMHNSLENTSAHSYKDSINQNNVSQNSLNVSTHQTTFTHTNTNTNTNMSDEVEEAGLSHDGMSKTVSSNSSYHGDNLPLSAGSNGSKLQVHTIKRMRGSRRFGRALGPPQRASRVTDHNSDSMVDDQHTPPADHDSDSKLKTPIGFKSEISQSERSVFMKSMDGNNPETPEIDLLSKGNEAEFRKRIDHQKRINEMQMQLDSISRTNEEAEKRISSLLNDRRESESPYKGFEKKEDPKFHHALNYREKYIDNFNRDKEKEKDDNGLSNNKEYSYDQPKTSNRIPLSNISSNVMNIAGESDNFRKPKLPKMNKPMHNSPINNQLNVQSVHPKHHMEGSVAVDSYPEDSKKKKSIIINGNRYEKLELLGRGGTSKVYRVRSCSNNRLYAIKKVTFDQFDDNCIKGFKGEIDLLLKLKDSERVVKLIDHAIGEGSIYLVMECGEIDLAHVLQHKLSMNKPFDLNFVKFHAIELLKCVKAVHEAEIVHSDLKPANFLFVRGVLKIIDFGIANAVPDHTANIYRESQIGTPNYMAPEALIEVNQSLSGLPMSDSQSTMHKNTWKVGKPSDIWSCGCIIYQMIYGRPPYGGYSGNQRIMAIMNPQIKIQFPSKGLGNVKVPGSAIELMKNCLSRNPNQRWTVDQCLSCDFLSPRVVSEGFIRDLVHSAVNFGYNNRVNGSGLITSDVYDRLVDTVLKQIEELNYG